MTFRVRVSLSILVFAMFCSAVQAQNGSVNQDSRAIEVLKSMSAYRGSLDQVVIKGVSFTDARLGGGLIVSNSTEVKVSMDQPGSLHISSFDGVVKNELYFHDGMLTVFNSSNLFYAQANIPKEIEAAIEFALEELGVEAPLLDMLYQDASSHLLGSDEEILYLTDKARIAGTNCHQIAIRGSEVDVQLWVEEGDRPLPRKIIITSKWEGGSPRFVTNLSWNSEPEFKAGKFEFKAPEGSTNIGFARDKKSGGE